MRIPLSRWALAALAVPLVACGPGAPGDAAELLAVLPEDVDLVAFVDVVGVRAHPLWSKVMEDPFVRGGEEMLTKLEELTGVDPFRDLHMLVFAARDLGEPDMAMAIIARGQIDRGRIERLLEHAGWEAEPGEGLDLFTLPFLPDQGGAPGLPDPAETRLAFLDDFTLALGSPGILEGTARVRRGNGTPLVETEDMGPFLREGLGSGQFWGVFRSGYLAEQLQSRIESGIPMLTVLKGFSGVQLIRFSVRLSDSIDLVARARTRTEEDSQLLADTLNGFLALAKLVAKDQPDLLRFLEGALVGLDLDSVRLSMNIDGATLDRIRGGLLSQLRE